MYMFQICIIRSVRKNIRKCHSIDASCGCSSVAVNQIRQMIKERKAVRMCFAIQTTGNTRGPLKPNRCISQTSSLQVPLSLPCNVIVHASICSCLHLNIAQIRLAKELYVTRNIMHASDYIIELPNSSHSRVDYCEVRQFQDM